MFSAHPYALSGMNVSHNKRSEAASVQFTSSYWILIVKCEKSTINFFVLYRPYTLFSLRCRGGAMIERAPYPPRHAVRWRRLPKSATRQGGSPASNPSGTPPPSSGEAPCSGSPLEQAARRPADSMPPGYPRSRRPYLLPPLREPSARTRCIHPIRH